MTTEEREKLRQKIEDLDVEAHEIKLVRNKLEELFEAYKAKINNSEALKTYSQIDEMLSALETISENIFNKKVALVDELKKTL